jgi:riboflavin kinase/FMN adenylyltransferase
MNCFDSVNELTKNIGKVALACGNFDGVHLGHQQLIKSLIHYSQQNKVTPAIFTFHPHPRKIIGHEKSVALLTSFEHKIKLFKRYGITTVICHPFTQATAQTNAIDFATNQLINPKIIALFVGENWKFGHHGKGSIKTLHQLSLKSDFQVNSITEIRNTTKKISSSNIRHHILQGEMFQAAQLLGRNFSLLGQVIPGEGIAQGKLGFPTANLEVNNEIIPPSGVYAGFIKIGQQIYKSIINIGYSPTFHTKPAPTKVEAHIFDFSGNLYQQEIEFEFIDFIRPEKKFPTKTHLIKEITNNIKTVKQILKTAKTSL